MNRFTSLTKKQKRVFLARSVISKIAAGTFKPTTGRMLVIADNYNSFPEAGEREHTVENIKEAPNCLVCALGSIHTAALIKDPHPRCYGKQVRSQASDQNRFKRTVLSKYFTEDQIKMIEAAYEGCQGIYFEEDFEGRGAELARAFYRRYSNKKTRLLKIMSNIVRNNGTFIPSQG